MAPGLRKKLPSARAQQLNNVQNSTSMEQSGGFSPTHGTDASLNQDSSQINNESGSASTSKKRGRGPTRGKELQRMNDTSKKRLEVFIDPIQGRPLDKKSMPKRYGYIIGHIYYIFPDRGDMYYLMCLINIVRGATCYEDYKKIQGVQHTYHETCYALRLLEDDS
ncbi:hypothetical protein DH2020_025697 [Rehmannia glutinosa]|uniref:Uncharacterized protein n=1 Tax=Rehmannia glutinosa TaxID=99300 RepID=A0ABR0W1E4_REHGL